MYTKLSRPAALHNLAERYAAANASLTLPLAASTSESAHGKELQLHVHAHVRQWLMRTDTAIKAERCDFVILAGFGVGFGIITVHSITTPMIWSTVPLSCLITTE